MTINYTDKGYGVHERIAAAGHSLHQLDGVWHSSDDVAVQAILDGYSLATCAVYTCDQVDAHAKDEFDRHVVKYSPGEMAGWALMQAEAAAYQADPAAPIPNLAAEAAVRGCPASAIASRVLGNAAALQGLRAAIMGTAGKHKDAIRACATFAEITVYNFRTGFPP